MRITKTQLKQIIKEELSALSETSDPLGGPTTIAPTSQDSQSATALKQVEQVLANLLKRIQAL